MSQLLTLKIKQNGNNKNKHHHAWISWEGGQSICLSYAGKQRHHRGQAQPGKCNSFPGSERAVQTVQFGVNYARVALKDPEQQEYYASKATKEKSAFNLAIADFLRKPCIDLIDASSYRGEIGDKILMIASGNAKIMAARISILDAGGIVLESGLCVQDAVTTNWVYTASTSQVQVTGLSVLAMVTDRPGHAAAQELAL